ncbi:MAG: MaoC family dehydratase [Halanaeroarchaeum sp.]
MPVASPGDTATASLSVTDSTIEEYADLVGDHNPLHLDPAYAADGIFGGRVAHGMLSAGVVSAALASLPGDIVYLSQDLAFEAPVRPGATVRATVTVEDRTDDDRLVVDTTATSDGETVLTGTATVLSREHEA